MSLLFGPVFSRRLGRSLGFDLVPYKICSMNCIYCEVGRTTFLTVERAAYVSWDKIKKTLKETAEMERSFDVLTFSGSGEPTLNIYFEKVVSEARKIIQKPIAVLTNSSFVWLSSVRKALEKVDFVLASLDSVRKESFIKVNRPHPGVPLNKIVEGLKLLREKMQGKLLLEVLFVKGVNDSEEDIEALNKTLIYINPHKVQLNTVVRPPAEKGVEPVSFSFLQKVAESLEVPAEVIVSSSAVPQEDSELSEEELIPRIIEYLKRRPAPADELARAFPSAKNFMNSVIEKLLSQGRIKTVFHQDKAYYVA